MKPYKPKVKAPDPELVSKTENILRSQALTTVCEESSCPNRAECYERGTATFMILGDTCTRACRFCNVKTGRGLPPDAGEPERIAKAVKAMGLQYVVITSVDRDDLPDYGAGHFANVVAKLRVVVPEVKIELLTPDFKADKKALDTVIASQPDKLAHNEETVKCLSLSVRPQSDYQRSLETLRYYAQYFDSPVKSSLMVGLGESEEELLLTMQDLYDVGVRELTLGQYLQPTQAHLSVAEYFPPEYFIHLQEKAYAISFNAVASCILVRSSYYAESL